MEENRSLPGRSLDIFVKRILARYCQKNEQIVFDAAGTKKTPLRLFICNQKVGCEELPVRCISDIKFLLCDTCQQIICNHKSKITVDFKLLLIVKYNNCNYQCLTLPDDAFRTVGENKVKVGIDSIPANPSQFPVVIGDVGNQRLEIIREGTGPNTNYFFRFTKNVPLSEFDDKIPQSALDDPSLMSHIVIKNVKYTVDVDGECTGVAGKCCSCPGDTNATIVDVAVFADIIDKIGIDQDIWVNGETDKEC